MSTEIKGHTPPTEYTIKLNRQARSDLPADDNRDFEEAGRGLIASDPELVIKRADDGSVLWDQTAYRFVEGDAPDSVHPSLWRQAKLNNMHGLYKVVPGIYQLRGYDLANLTIIEGESGWIIVDPLTCEETAAAAMAFAEQHLDPRPVSAIIFTHSHVDHYGGVLAIISAEEAVSRAIPIIAPHGFMEESVSESVLAGPAMRRRSQYMYGNLLEKSPLGHVDTGLGKQPAIGKVGILPPTDLITHTPQELEIDGVPFIFQYAPESEAVAELTFYLPEHRAYCGAEIVSRNLHNVYTLRGTKARDALNWSRYIHEARSLFGEAEVYFGTHHWPVWGREAVQDFLKIQRDSYKFIHDQTLRMANTGMTPMEISENLRFPEPLQQTYSNRDYYGTVRHNAKAVYTYYFGWYDANPCHLNPLPPEESAVQYVAFMGGADAVLAKAQDSFDRGAYRWVAEVLNHLVFAEPENARAKEMLAAAYDQLGYQSESGPWRDVYLTAAQELRHGLTKVSPPLANGRGLIRQMPLSSFFDIMAVRLDGPAAAGVKITLNFIFTDRDECHVLRLENSVLNHDCTRPDPEANASLTMTHELYIRIFTRQITMIEAAEKGELKIEGSTDDLIRFFSLLPSPPGTFNIITP